MTRRRRTGLPPAEQGTPPRQDRGARRRTAAALVDAQVNEPSASPSTEDDACDAMRDAPPPALPNVDWALLLGFHAPSPRVAVTLHLEEIAGEDVFRLERHVLRDGAWQLAEPIGGFVLTRDDLRWFEGVVDGLRSPPPARGALQ